MKPRWTQNPAYCLSYLGLILVWALTNGPSLRAQGSRMERSFQDPKTGRSGLYTIVMPSDSAAAKSQGLLVLFHGSGQTSRYADNFEGALKAATELKLTPLLIQAPNGADTWPAQPVGPSNKHDLYAKNLLDSLFKAFPALDPNRVLLVGISAGSTFLSGDFLPRFIGDYKGGAVLLCGGGAPVIRDPDVFMPLTEAMSRAFRLAFYIQKKDFLYGQTQTGMNYWRARKAKITAVTPEGGSHCGFDVFGEMGRLGRSVLSPFPAINSKNGRGG